MVTGMHWSGSCFIDILTKYTTTTIIVDTRYEIGDSRY